MQMRALFSSLLLAWLLAGCKTSTALTAEAVGCSLADVEIVDSPFKREGSTTAWCASCQGRLYQCAATPARDRVECREVKSGGQCT
jgi:hypothetical protein